MWSCWCCYEYSADNVQYCLRPSPTTGHIQLANQSFLFGELLPKLSWYNKKNAIKNPEGESDLHKSNKSNLNIIPIPHEKINCIRYILSQVQDMKKYKSLRKSVVCAFCHCTLLDVAYFNLYKKNLLWIKMSLFHPLVEKLCHTISGYNFFFQAIVPNVHWFQLLKYDDLLLFSIVYN